MEVQGKNTLINPFGSRTQMQFRDFLSIGLQSTTPSSATAFTTSCKKATVLFFSIESFREMDNNHWQKNEKFPLRLKVWGGGDQCYCDYPLLELDMLYHRFFLLSGICGSKTEILPKMAIEIFNLLRYRKIETTIEQSLQKLSCRCGEFLF